MVTETPVPVQKAFLNHKSEEVVICPDCGVSKVIKNMTYYKHPEHQIRIICMCGCAFDIEFDPRRAYRKKVCIPGICIDTKSGKSWNIIIQDISLTGIGFKTKQSPPIGGEQQIEIQFILNHESLEEISKMAITKRIKSNFIGAEFCDIKDHFQELDDYLQSS
jgi:hypothetical protein